MAQQQPTRNLIAIIFRNFINSFKFRPFQGTLVGTDYFGNKYYEIRADPSSGKRRANRWFQPVHKEDFEQELPAEWEAWLRGRREQPPGEEEVMKNVAATRLKRQNAIEVDAKGGKSTPMVKGIETFPSRPEYERVPGKSQQV